MKRIIIAIACLAIAGLVAGCDKSSNSPNQQQIEQQYTFNQQRVIDKAEPFPKLYDSAARKIQSYYYTAEADPNKIWYLTLLSLDGSPIATYTIRGPVESQGDQVTNPSQVTCNYSGDTGVGCGVIALAEPNGVYQQNSTNDHIAILTDGAQIRFDNNYIVSDQPMKISSPVKLSVNESAQISSTDLSKSQGGIVPSKK